MRCLTLASALRDKGNDIWFACHAQTLDTIPILRDSNYNLIELPSSEHEHQHLRSSLPHIEWLVVDHYALDAAWMSKLRGWAGHILAIDDLANRPLDCDILLDQTLGREVDDYRPHTPSHCEFLLGPRYALLRPEFAAARAEHLAQRRYPTAGPTKVLVAMSATDPDNATEFVLEALDRVAKDIEVITVLGSAAPYLDAVRRRARTLSHSTKVLTDVSDMATLMVEADIAFGANGTSSWERCCLGLPSITIELADNQRKIGAALSEAGAIHFLGRLPELSADRLTQEFTQFISDPERMARMSRIAGQLCDGKGAVRVADRILQ